MAELQMQQQLCNIREREKKKIKNLRNSLHRNYRKRGKVDSFDFAVADFCCCPAETTTTTTSFLLLLSNQYVMWLPSLSLCISIYLFYLYSSPY